MKVFGLGDIKRTLPKIDLSPLIKEGFVAMLGPFIDTLMVCTMTALAILVTGAWKTQADGVSLTAAAFESSFSGVGNYILLACVFVFSISSLFFRHNKN